MSDEELNSYDIISTYLGSGLFNRLQGSWIKIVVLRDSVNRLVSSYWHLRTNPRFVSFASGLAKSCALHEYLASREPSVIFQTTNVQAWTVLGDRSVAFRQRYIHLSHRELCELAIERLRIYDFVGFTEHLDDLWTAICLRFGWSLSPLPRLNQTAYSNDLALVNPKDEAFHTALGSAFVHRVLVAGR
ncbi:MAG: hypothetical protein U1G07_24170 [Verrucomicrobiota bacterium]